MIASIYLADRGLRSSLASLRQTPDADSTAGLHYAVKLGTAPLGGSSVSPPSLRRVGFLGLWEDDASLERFLAEHPVSDGWHARLDPVQIHEYHEARGSQAPGSWPGLPATFSPPTDVEGPAAVLTLARTRPSQFVRFVRASAWAGKPLATSPGLIWATAMARPLIVATLSLWESAAALEAYAYCSEGHKQAMAADRAKGFHQSGVFIRFRPYLTAGHLNGRNPLPADWMATASAQG